MAVTATAADHLSKEQIAELQTELRSQWQEVLQRHGVQQVVESNERALEPGDEADLAVAERQREFELELGERERNRMLEIDAALERIKSGSYGICEESEEPIAYERLKRIPWARYTAEVQQQIEDGTIRTTGEEQRSLVEITRQVDEGPGKESDLTAGSDPS